VVVVRDVDHLTRNQSDWSWFEKAAVEHRVLLSAYADADLDLSTAEGAYHGDGDAAGETGGPRQERALPGVFRVGFPDGPPVREMPRCVLVPSVRPAVRVRALRADARARGGTGRPSGRSLW